MTQKKLLGFLDTTFLNPLREFLHDSRAIGIILLVATAVSLILANIPGSNYINFWASEIPFAHSLHLPHTILHVINDGLMTIFFFLVGMEIRRELINGELASFKKAILPAAGAVGGMMLPAAIFLLFNAGTMAARGWAVPTATDIAFSLGVASLLGKRVPIALKIFLTALAIIDDLGAILIIALFYGNNINMNFLIAAIVIVFLTLLVKLNTRRPSIALLLLGVALWYCMLNSGVHATIAGVLFAFLIPARHLSRLEMKLHHPVYFFIMPLFAFANTAIFIPEGVVEQLGTNMSVGIVLGLLIGKPLGIILFSFLLVKLKFAHLPSHTTWLQMVGAGILAGIGFTMSIFISTLAFSTSQADVAKLSVLIASITSILLGYLWLKVIPYKLTSQAQR